MRISDWSSDVCSSDLRTPTSISTWDRAERRKACLPPLRSVAWAGNSRAVCCSATKTNALAPANGESTISTASITSMTRSEEHTSELQSLMRISYAGFSLIKNNTQTLTLQPQHINTTSTHPNTV